MFTDTFAGIAPASVALFVAMQLVGAASAICSSAPSTRLPSPLPQGRKESTP